MAFSFTQHIGDGSTTTFTFSFTGPGVGYYDDDQIKVYVNNAPADFTLTGDNQVTLTTAPALNSRIWIKREPDITDTYTNFSRGNSFGKDNINRSFQQMLYLVQRIQDGFKEDGYYQKQDMNLGDFKITNLGLGVDDQDACTISQLEDRVASNEANLTASEVAQAAAELAQSLAEIARIAAQAAQVDAESARDLSLTYSNNSSASATTSENYSDLAERWSNEAEDVEVTSGKYSAYHWSEKARDFSEGYANNIGFTPSGTLSSLNVQDALVELDSKKLPVRGGTISRNLTITGDLYSNKTAILTPIPSGVVSVIVRGDSTVDTPTIRFSNYALSATKDLAADVSGDIYWGGNTIWHAGNMGTGSSLDADKLDSKHSSGFAYSEDIVNIDVNGLIQSGMYRYNIPPNIPSTVNNGNLIVAHGGRDTLFQIAGNYNSSHIMWRGASGIGSTPVFSDWREIWHSGYMDPGADAIGSIKLARCSAPTLSGKAVDGSTINEGRFSTSGTWSDNGVLTGTGTWRSMQTLAANYPIGLFQRIA